MIIRVLIIFHVNAFFYAYCMPYRPEHCINLSSLGWRLSVQITDLTLALCRTSRAPSHFSPPKPRHLALTQSSQAPMADCDSRPAVVVVANTPSVELASWSSLLGSRPRYTSFCLPDAPLAPQLHVPLVI